MDILEQEDNFNNQLENSAANMTTYAQFFPVIKKHRPSSVVSSMNRTGIQFEDETIERQKNQESASKKQSKNESSAHKPRGMSQNVNAIVPEDFSKV